MGRKLPRPPILVRCNPLDCSTPASSELIQCTVVDQAQRIGRGREGHGVGIGEESEGEREAEWPRIV